MGREETVFPTDVLTALEQRGGQATRAEIATDLDCSTGTVSKKIAQLVHDGENIGFGKNGLFLQNKEDVYTKEGADLAHAWTKRLFNSLKMWAQRGNNHRAVAIEARKRFAKELTRDERETLKGHLLLISRVVDAVNLDEDLQ